MFENKNPLNHLEELGEFGLIEHLNQFIKIHHSSTIKGIGDDAAIIDAENKKVVISTDLLIEGVHFDLSYVPLKHLGYKAVAVNLSDIYAMNATPSHITVSLALSSKYTLEAIEELYSGINLACNNYKIDVIGGDTTSSLKGLTISITVVGFTELHDVVYRNGAQEKDLICLSGNVGAAYAGLQLLEREKKLFIENPNVQPDLSGHDYVLERQLKPEPRADIIRLLKENNIVPTSMIDISDGLTSEILHLCKQSNTGCRIMANKIPIDQGTFNVAEELNISPYTMALNGGEDYELLFTISPSDYDKILNIPDVSIIGFMTDRSLGYHMLDDSNTAIPLYAQGWDSFLKK